MVMRRQRILLSLLFLVCAVPVRAGKEDDFSRYEVILRRQPFGRMAVMAVKSPAPTAIAGPQKRAFIEDIRLFAVTESSDGTYAGFMNVARKPARNYYMKAGEKKDGIQVVDVVYEAEKVLLRKGEEQFWAYMPGASPDGPGGSVGRELVRPSGTRAKVSLIRKTVGKQGMTKAEYAKGRADGTIPAPTSPRRQGRGPSPMEGLTTEERDLVMRKYNLEVIKSGGKMGPALPIPLTAAEDAELVEGGFLPPMK
jgi:hypothetical protein